MDVVAFDMARRERGLLRVRIGEITSDDRLASGEILREQRLGETRAPAKLVALSEAELSNLPPTPDAKTVRSPYGGQIKTWS
jgi:hypothetical protein